MKVPASPQPPRSCFDEGTKVISNRNYNMLKEVEKLPVDVSFTKIWLHLSLVQSPDLEAFQISCFIFVAGHRKKNGKKNFWRKNHPKYLSIYTAEWFITAPWISHIKALLSLTKIKGKCWYLVVSYLYNSTVDSLQKHVFNILPLTFFFFGLFS